MVRKGQTKGDQFAVKEFRKPSAKESEAEYVRKVNEIQHCKVVEPSEHRQDS